MTGHLLGAAGGVEAVFTVLALRDQVAPPTANLVDRDPQCDLDFVPLVARDMKIRAAMSNSFGFGGTNATLVFRAPRLSVCATHVRAAVSDVTHRHGPDRPEIRRHLGRQHRPHQECRAARRALSIARAISSSSSCRR